MMFPPHLPNPEAVLTHLRTGEELARGMPAITDYMRRRQQLDREARQNRASAGPLLALGLAIALCALLVGIVIGAALSAHPSALSSVDGWAVRAAAHTAVPATDPAGAGLAVTGAHLDGGHYPVALTASEVQLADDARAMRAAPSARTSLDPIEGRDPTTLADRGDAGIHPGDGAYGHDVGGKSGEGRAHTRGALTEGDPDSEALLPPDHSVPPRHDTAPSARAIPPARGAQAGPHANALIIREAAAEFGADPEVMLRRARCESYDRLDHNAIGDGGRAIGVFQWHAESFLFIARLSGLGYDLRQYGDVTAQSRLAAWAEANGWGHWWTCR